ncbi:unnamed protein product [Penicillium salamii]|uniref:Protein kinase domain-containing protein n=1 Tax=Penicillium salamii TaxID=1612424 RepID=A0A9W4IMH4_9EURO|nr:unnamed protein product [Penicillium salamii]CAG8095029.1 unnamed protein product [Penicillium salamii]CAG8254129.1 unnamed protein product [Penicillium salamii]CAG8254814.1 unnamed protein product [Penicillium salamii]CAG8306457.1 unnamed protein product [Penicillium salamii]
MRVLEFREDWGGPLSEFQKTIVVYEEDGLHYRAFSRERYASEADIRFVDLYSTNMIRGRIYPLFNEAFTKAEGSPEQLAELHFKTPTLTIYTPRNPGLIAETWHTELTICELIRKNPHPNIAVYHGCSVSEDNEIRGAYFSCYDQTLMDKVNPTRLSKLEFAWDNVEPDLAQIDRWVQGIQAGLDHLHSLGIVHNDINPNNIMFEGDTPVIIDFDSARVIGGDLTWVKQTDGWFDPKTNRALVSNDNSALFEIKAWLMGTAELFQF